MEEEIIFDKYTQSGKNLVSYITKVNTIFNFNDPKGVYDESSLNKAATARIKYRGIKEEMEAEIVKYQSDKAKCVELCRLLAKINELAPDITSKLLSSQTSIKNNFYLTDVEGEEGTFTPGLSKAKEGAKQVGLFLDARDKLSKELDNKVEEISTAIRVLEYDLIDFVSERMDDLRQQIQAYNSSKNS